MPFTTGPQVGSPTALRNVQVDALATQIHYRHHIQPIWEALYPLDRGVFASDPRELQGRTNPVITAGYRDLLATKDRPGIFVEHGAGQTYSGRAPAHAGGRGRESVRLFVNPSLSVADRNQQAYPNAESIAVGSPVMDRHLREHRKPEPGLVAIAFHWNAQVCPESRSAFLHYHHVIGKLAREREVIGHGHPRVERSLRRFFAERGIRWASLDEVYERAAVLVVDNSSIGWEFMSLDRPVVWLNAPWYRRRAEHGMRFWEYADAGVQVDEPGELSFAISEALMDTNTKRRHEVIEQVYSHTDGKAALRAADAIASLVNEGSTGCHSTTQANM